MKYLFVFFLAFPAFAVEPEIAARSGILIEVETNTILFEKDADLIIPPASLTKLVALDVTLDTLKNQGISYDDFVDIPEAAYYVNAPPRSSLMFLAANQQVTWLDLLRGLMISSGNDAAVAVASNIAGSHDDFVHLMNERVREIGLEVTSFVDSSGYSRYNLTTAREMAVFCLLFLEKHPEALNLIFSLESFTFPRDEHWFAEPSIHNITQLNRNTLVGKIDGVDGLKTGYIDKSGYNIAVTAKRGDRRLLSVTLGGPGENHLQGGQLRELDNISLIDYGFSAYTTFTPEMPDFPSIPVWKGQEKAVHVKAINVPRITIRHEEIKLLFVNYAIMDELIAPVFRNTNVGTVSLQLGNSVVFNASLVTKDTVDKGGFFVWIWDSIKLFFRDLFA